MRFCKRLTCSRFPFHELHAERMQARSSLTIDHLLLESTIRDGFLHGKEERKRKKMRPFFSQRNPAGRSKLGLSAFSSRYLIPAVTTLRNVTGGRYKNKIASLVQPSRLNFLFLNEVYKIVGKKYKKCAVEIYFLHERNTLFILLI